MRTNDHVTLLSNKIYGPCRPVWPPSDADLKNTNFLDPTLFFFFSFFFLGGGGGGINSHKFGS